MARRATSPARAVELGATLAAALPWPQAASGGSPAGGPPTLSTLAVCLAAAVAFTLLRRRLVGLAPPPPELMESLQVIADARQCADAPGRTADGAGGDGAAAFGRPPTDAL
ncbi:MAG: hypothetical protein R3F56_11005 [Planctomycetota bacterium]